MTRNTHGAFTLRNVMTLQVGKWYVLGGLVIAVAFVAAKIVAADTLAILRPPADTGVAVSLAAAGMWAIRRAALARELTISVTAEAIVIDAAGRGRLVVAPIDDFRGVRTLHPSNAKGDVQAEILLRNRKLSLTTALDDESKAAFDAFCRFCEERLGFAEREVPFSIWTHNWQGVRYVEYANPTYR